MINTSEKYLIDTNSLITPYNTFYPLDFVPQFWKQLEEAILAGTVIIMDLVKEELIKGDDELSDWIERIDPSFILTRKDQNIIMKYGGILSHIQLSEYYTPKALSNWARAEIADPWLIAAAATYGYTIVTFENPNGNLNSKNKSSKAKIPDICNEFGVRCINLYTLMREVSFKM